MILVGAKNICSRLEKQNVASRTTLVSELKVPQCRPCNLSEMKGFISKHMCCFFYYYLNEASDFTSGKQMR